MVEDGFKNITSAQSFEYRGFLQKWYVPEKIKLIDKGD